MFSITRGKASLIQQRMNNRLLPNLISKCTVGRSTLSSSTADNDSWNQGFRPVYVHHVSKLTLEHLQEKESNWLVQQGLDAGLQVNDNGTFLLRYPAKSGYDAGRIWTSYDSARKQHWLSVQRKKLAVKFLLKDHGRSVASRTLHDSEQTERQIFRAVRQMILSINQVDAEQSM